MWKLLNLYYVNSKKNSEIYRTLTSRGSDGEFSGYFQIMTNVWLRESRRSWIYNLPLGDHDQHNSTEISGKNFPRTWNFPKETFGLRLWRIWNSKREAPRKSFDWFRRKLPEMLSNTPLSYILYRELCY